MKKLNIAGLILLVSLSSVVVSCSLGSKSNTNTENNTSSTNTNNADNSNSDANRNNINTKDSFDETDTTKIDARYKNVDKTKLDYDKGYSSNTYYETKDSFVGSEAGIPKINNKDYMQILEDYTYASEVNPTKKTYNESVKLAKSILPNDIKEVQKKYDNETSKTHITYSSSQGNFVVGLNYDYDRSQASDFSPYSENEIIVGIDYMKEISE